MAKTTKDYYVLTPHGPLAGIKVWPKRGKAGENGKLDIEFKYGCLDQRLLGKPMKFLGKKAAEAFARAYGCFSPDPVYVVEEPVVRDWMKQRDEQRALRQKQADNYQKRMAKKELSFDR